MKQLVRYTLTNSRRACARSLRVVLAAAVLASLLALPAAAAAAVGPSIQVVRNQTFTTRGPTTLSLDAWHPRTSRSSMRRPIVVMVHGGGWGGGSRFEWARHGWPQNFAAAGYVVVAPSYRLACPIPEPDENGALPAGVELCGHSMGEQRNDVLEAIRWSIRNARRLGGDPNRIVLLGGSAGGHLALLAGTHPGLSRRIAGIAAISPPVDLPMIGRRSLWLHGAVERAIRCGWAGCPARWRIHSPIHQAARVRSFPPTYLYASRRDVRVRRVDVLRLGRVLRGRTVRTAVPGIAKVTIREPIVTSSGCHGPWACERFAVRSARMPLRRDLLRWIEQVTRPAPPARR